jgi:excisionase family DNA binding protein
MAAPFARPIPVDVSSDELEALILRLGLVKPSYSRLEAAAILGVSESGIDRLLHAGTLASFAIGERVTIVRNDLAKFMFERERGYTHRRLLPEPKPQTEKPRRPGRPRKRAAGSRRTAKKGK